jgi:hypothetical protein
MSHGDSPLASGDILDDDERIGPDAGNPLEEPGDLLDDEDRTGLDASPVIAPEEEASTSEGEASTSTENPQERIWRKHNALLRDLLTSLDAMIYVELAAIYYLEYVGSFYVLVPNSNICIAHQASSSSFAPLSNSPR